MSKVVTTLRPSCNRCGRTPRSGTGEYKALVLLRLLRISPRRSFWGRMECRRCGWSFRVSGPTAADVAAAMLAPGLLRWRRK